MLIYIANLFTLMLFIFESRKANQQDEIKLLSFIKMIYNFEFT